MKIKSLIIAASLVCGTAFAETANVNLYGIIDLGITTATNAKATSNTVTGVSNGGLYTSRWGITGGEDLGGGTKVSFTLESEILADNGSQGGADLFHRGAFIKLDQAGSGSFRIGRIMRNDYSLSAKYDAFGGSNVGGWLASGTTGTVALGTTERISNAVELQTASIGGLVLTAQYGSGEVAASNQAGRTISLGAEYTVGNFSTAVNHAEKNAATLTSVGYATTKNNAAYASYDFKVARLNAGYATAQTEGVSAKQSGYFVGTIVPVSSKVNLLAQYNQLDSGTGMKPSSYAIGATYAFSKRTTGYVLSAISVQDHGSAQNIVNTGKYAGFDGPSAGMNQTVASIGIAHRF